MLKAKLLLKKGTLIQERVDLAIPAAYGELIKTTVNYYGTFITPDVFILEPPKGELKGEINVTPVSLYMANDKEKEFSHNYIFVGVLATSLEEFEKNVEYYKPLEREAAKYIYRNYDVEKKYFGEELITFMRSMKLVTN